MTPVEAKYRLSGFEKEKIVAEDGVSVALDTPAGLARASLDPRKGNIFDGTLGERFSTQFPGQPPYREFVSIFGIFLGDKKDVNMPTLTRCKNYQTNKGEVLIELKAINTDTSEIKK